MSDLKKFNGFNANGVYGRDSVWPLSLLLRQPRHRGNRGSRVIHGCYGGSNHVQDDSRRLGSPVVDLVGRWGTQRVSAIKIAGTIMKSARITRCKKLIPRCGASTSSVSSVHSREALCVGAACPLRRIICNDDGCPDLRQYHALLFLTFLPARSSIGPVC